MEGVYSLGEGNDKGLLPSYPPVLCKKRLWSTILPDREFTLEQEIKKRVYSRAKSTKIFSVGNERNVGAGIPEN